MEILGFFYIPNCLLAFGLVLFCLYVYLTWNFGFFKSRGVPGPTPLPVVGTSYSVLSGKGVHEQLKDFLAKYGHVVGLFEGRDPVYIISDSEILKHIMVKQFSSFVGRRKFLFTGVLDNSLFHCAAKNWKRMRSLLTPAFISGKMRQMEGPINRNVETLVRNLDQAADGAKSIANVKEYTGGYTMDVIASTAFSLDIDSQNSTDDPFVKHARLLLDISIDGWFMMAAVFLRCLIPLLEALGATYYPKSFKNFFEDIIRKISHQRKNENVSRVDLLNLMLNAHELQDDQEVRDDLRTAGLTADTSETKGLTDNELLANTMLIFAAGYDTTANTLAFLFYNLATHSDVQEKVHEEITQAMEGHDSPSYDIVNKLPYLDMCISETLRLYPIIPTVDRRANEDVTINGHFFPKGIVAMISIYTLHHNPAVWPDPDKFDPERFTPEAKAARSPFCYMPFGMGPRQCLGMRLAQMEMKMAVTKVLTKFRFLPNSETQIPLKLKPAIFTEPEKPISLAVERR